MPARVRLELGDGDDWNSFSRLPGQPAGRGLRRRRQGSAAELRRRRPRDARRRRWQRPAQGLADATRRCAAAPATTRSTAAAATTTSRAATATTRSRPTPTTARRNDYVDGGPGIDTVDDWSIPDNDYHPPISVSMDGVANDGRPGEADNVVNVEKIESHVSGTLSGSAGDDEFRVYANVDEGNSTLLGNGGNDKLTAGDYQDTLDGGPGQRRHQRRLRQRRDDGRPGPGHDLRGRHQRLVRLLLLHLQDPVRQRRRQRPRRRGGHDRLRRRRGPRDRRQRSTSSPTARRSRAGGAANGAGARRQPGQAGARASPTSSRAPSST